MAYSLDDLARIESKAETAEDLAGEAEDNAKAAERAVRESKDKVEFADSTLLRFSRESLAAEDEADEADFLGVGREAKAEAAEAAERKAAYMRSIARTIHDRAVEAQDRASEARNRALEARYFASAIRELANLVRAAIEADRAREGDT